MKRNFKVIKATNVQTATNVLQHNFDPPLPDYKPIRLLLLALSSTQKKTTNLRVQVFQYLDDLTQTVRIQRDISCCFCAIKALTRDTVTDTATHVINRIGSISPLCFWI